MFVLLPDEAFQRTLYLVNVNWYVWLHIVRVVYPVGGHISYALHVIDLVVAPTVHAQ